MKVRFFDPGKGYLKIKKEINSEIRRVLTAGELILRKDIQIFEKNLAEFVGTSYAVALGSGTDALLLSLKAAGIGQGDEVVVPSHTFKATAGAVLNAGADLRIMDMDCKFQRTKDLKAIIPVHIAGELAETNYDGLTVIEDACQALGAVKNPTSFTQCWSFYPAKILGAYGDAGAITTNDERAAAYIREYRNHFKNDDMGFGGNHRMDNLQAAILNVKFKYLPEFLSRRKEIAEMYLDGLHGVGLPNNTPGRVWQDFIIRTKKRNELYDFLKKQGIETMKNDYPFSWLYKKLPLSKEYEGETLRLPCNPDLKNREIKYVIRKVNEFFA